MTRAGSEPGGVGAPKGSEEKTRKGDRYGDRKIDVRSAIEDLNTKIPPRSKDGRRSAGKRWLMDGEDTGREAVWRRHISQAKSNILFICLHVDMHTIGL